MTAALAQGVRVAWPSVRRILAQVAPAQPRDSAARQGSTPRSVQLENATRHEFRRMCPSTAPYPIRQFLKFPDRSHVAKKPSRHGSNHIAVKCASIRICENRPEQMLRFFHTPVPARPPVAFPKSWYYNDLRRVYRKRQFPGTGRASTRIHPTHTRRNHS